MKFSNTPRECIVVRLHKIDATAEIPWPGWEFILNHFGFEKWIDGAITALQALNGTTNFHDLINPPIDEAEQQPAVPPEAPPTHEQFYQWIKEHPGHPHTMQEAWSKIKCIPLNQVRNLCFKTTTTRSGATRQVGSTAKMQLQRAYKATSDLLTREGWIVEEQGAGNQPRIHTWNPPRDVQ